MQMQCFYYQSTLFVFGSGLKLFNILH